MTSSSQNLNREIERTSTIHPLVMPLADPPLSPTLPTLMIQSGAAPTRYEPAPPAAPVAPTPLSKPD